MPELPEVAYQKKYVDATALHKQIVEIGFGAAKIFQSPENEFRQALLKNEFTGTHQLGKYLFLELNFGKNLVVHFGMTGKMEYYQHDEAPKHAQLTVYFKDNSRLSFVCPRKFGKIFLTESMGAFQKNQNLGPHALDLKEEDFVKMFENKKGAIKSALMDQRFIAGLGNLYVDEILFQSGIHPKTKIEKLEPSELKEMFVKMIKILNKVIKSKSQGEKLPDSYLRSHRTQGDDCPNCKGKVSMLKVGGRSTYICPECQQEKS